MPDIDASPEIQALIASQFAGMIGSELNAVDQMVDGRRNKELLRGQKINKAAIIGSTGMVMPGQPTFMQNVETAPQQLSSQQLAMLEHEVRTSTELAPQYMPQPSRSQIEQPLRQSQILSLLNSDQSLILLLQTLTISVSAMQMELQQVRKLLTNNKKSAAKCQAS